MAVIRRFGCRKMPFILPVPFVRPGPFHTSRQSDLCVRDKAIRFLYDWLQDEMQQRTIKIECVLLPFRKSACNDISGISQGNAGMLQAER
jgi:hypothetical protein